MKVLISYSILILLTAYVVYSWFLYLDLDNKCTFVMIPTFQPSNLSTRETIEFLKNSSPDNYQLLCRHVSVINKNPTCGGFDGGCYHPEKARTIYIGNDQNNIALAAAIIVHETCHAIQGQQGRGLVEGECYKAGAEYLKKLTKLY